MLVFGDELIGEPAYRGPQRACLVSLIVGRALARFLWENEMLDALADFFSSYGPELGFDMARLGMLVGVLSLAAFLGLMLSFRFSPDRYQFNVLQAHVFLASAGALFMLVIGGEIVTAVGLLGAASVVRYRYAIRNPRDAGTLIIALGLGMACGSGAIALAIVAAIFMALIGNLFNFLPGVLPFGLGNPRGQVTLRIDMREFDPDLTHVRGVLQKHGGQAHILSIDRKDRERKGSSTEVLLHISYPVGDFDLDTITLELLDDSILRIVWQEPDLVFE
jgi:uncharacterized membrane protein YhiD involved in acid resistance